MDAPHQRPTATTSRRLIEMCKSVEPLLIVGASARAAAHSALRAGYAPLAIDQFGDADVPSHDSPRTFRYFNRELLLQVAAAPEAAWLYTGGLENHPALVERIAQHRPLLGNRGAVLREVRNLTSLRSIVRRARCDLPESRDRPDGLPTDGSWLCKPIRSGGGLQISPWHGQRPTSDSRRLYWQRRLDGTVWGATFVANGSRALLIGVCQAISSAHDDYHYRGSIGPIPLLSKHNESLQRLGDQLVASTGLVGLFGVDLLVTSEMLWVLEVNPRYTASVELLERAVCVPAMAWHVDACREGRLPDRASITSSRLFGKQIIYAPNDMAIADETVTRMLAEQSQFEWPEIADIPRGHTLVAARQPLASVFAEGDTLSEVHRQLELAEQRLLTQFASARPDRHFNPLRTS